MPLASDVIKLLGAVIGHSVSNQKIEKVKEALMKGSCKFKVYLAFYGHVGNAEGKDLPIPGLIPLHLSGLVNC